MIIRALVRQVDQSVHLARNQDVSGVKLEILGCHDHANGVQGYATGRGASNAAVGDFLRRGHHTEIMDCVTVQESQCHLKFKTTLISK